jgi:hypothetical protein
LFHARGRREPSARRLLSGQRIERQLQVVPGHPPASVGTSSHLGSSGPFTAGPKHHWAQAVAPDLGGALRLLLRRLHTECWRRRSAARGTEPQRHGRFRYWSSSSAWPVVADLSEKRPQLFALIRGLKVAERALAGVCIPAVDLEGDASTQAWRAVTAELWGKSPVGIHNGLHAHGGQDAWRSSLTGAATLH